MTYELDPEYSENYEVELTPRNIAFLASRIGFTETLEPFADTDELWTHVYAPSEPGRPFPRYVSSHSDRIAAWESIPAEWILADDVGANLCLKVFRRFRTNLIDLGTPILNDNARVKFTVAKLSPSTDPENAEMMYEDLELTYTGKSYNEAVYKATIGMMAVQHHNRLQIINGGFLSPIEFDAKVQYVNQEGEPIEPPTVESE